MNWRLGTSRIALGLWAIWAVGLLALVVGGDSPREDFLSADFLFLLFGPLVAFVFLGWFISWVIEGFKAPE